MISTPAFFSRFAAAMASSWDFPSVSKTRKNGMSDRAPASTLMFSSMTWSSAWPGRWMCGYMYSVVYVLCACNLKRAVRAQITEHMNTNSTKGANCEVCSPVNVFPPLYLKFRTASNSWSLVVKLLSCHSVRGSLLYWVRPEIFFEGQTSR